MKFKYLFFIALSGLIATSAQADVITWSPSVNLYQGATVETFVSTNGELAVAYNNTLSTNGAAADATVNGVTFVVGTVGNTLVGSGGESITINGGTDNATAFGDGEFTSNTEIFNLLRGGTFNINSVTLGGLQSGYEYELQVFTHDGRSSRNENFETGFGDGTGGGAVGISQLSNQVPGSGTGLTGDYIIGTFTAGAETLEFDVFGRNNPANNFVSGNSQSQINGIQLRITAVPEPGSIAILSIGAFGLIGLRRRS